MAVEEDDVIGVPEWVVTFGDMMSLLLTFFIILLSMSEMKEEDETYQAVVESIRKQFGHSTSMDSPAPGRTRARNSRLARRAILGRAKRRDTHRGGAKVKAPIGDHNRVISLRPGDRVGTGIQIVFEGVSEDLTEDHKRKLLVAAEIYGGKPQKIEVRGHTSRKQPSDGTLWDLGYRRAQTVMDHLQGLGIHPERFVISTVAAHEPLTFDTDPLHSKKNSRVEVFMLNQTVHEVQPKRNNENQPIYKEQQ